MTMTTVDVEHTAASSQGIQAVARMTVTAKATTAVAAAMVVLAAIQLTRSAEIMLEKICSPTRKQCPTSDRWSDLIGCQSEHLTIYNRSNERINYGR